MAPWTAPLYSLLAILYLSQFAAAHFYLNYPPTIGFDDDLESTAPCGSFTPNFATDNVTDYHVGGDSLSLTSIHPQATWLFRATLDITAASNWTDLRPPVLQSGLGAYCEQGITLPAAWVGSKGIIGVVQDAPDGILFQCAAVHFVAGSTATPSTCTNVTGTTAVYTTDAALASLPTGTASASSSSTSTSSASSSTAKSAATPVRLESRWIALTWTVVVAMVTLSMCKI